MPQGECTRTTFNALRKPLLVIHPDGSEMRHCYHKNGTLRKTIHPDQTEEHYTHDSFERMTSHHIYAPDKTLLSSERWIYSTFQLISYTDSRGLTTHYTYDGAGRKISERAADRQKRYTYDALGFLKQTIEEDVYHIELHDVLGRVTEEWVEQDDLRENYMRFFYDAENHKEKAIRVTSQGEAADLFFYDVEGRLTRHIDPLQFVTEFAYEEVVNDLGQWVMQKTTRDPLGNATIETYDATNRLALCERKDPRGNTVSKEKLFYDRSGNKSTQEITVYENFQPLKIVTNRWEYNVLSQVIREIEAGQKTTEYEYDSRGHISKRTLPSGTTFFYNYDGLDRLLELKSSDGSVHYTYFYQQGPEPVEIQDLVHNNTLRRSYNLFGQVLSETTPYGLRSEWEYDESGRCSLFTLPDNSSISYYYYGLHLRSIHRWSPSDKHLYEHAYTQFDVNGHVAQEKLIHGEFVASTHDLLERPHTQVSPWMTQSVCYGPSSLVTEITNSLLGNKTYAYDALNQLTQEGEQRFDFNSIGNSTAHETNDLNQILRTPKEALSYDADGNPRDRLRANQLIQYHYDALGRLTSITTSGNTVSFAYDPLSRLLSKTTDTTQLYLYDQEREIGTCTPDGTILQLKVLGLGLKGDIGASVALELNGQTYAPLHDFGGNIIALIDAQNQLAETYQIDAFGKETNLSTPPITPWRFCSKRTEEGLVFFGIRFYDPSLGRWLTPDPAGFADGPNLYLYVLNSPLNRLDLFGLLGESPLEPKYNLYVPILIPTAPPPRFGNFVCLQATVNKVKVDVLLIAEQYYHLQYTPDELQAGKVNILQHFLNSSTNMGPVGLITMINGINTTLEECAANCQTIADNKPGVPVIGIYNPTVGVVGDGVRSMKELFGNNSRGVKNTRRVFGAIAENIGKINPNYKWVHVSHSEGGAITHYSIKGLPREQRKILHRSLISLNFGPLKPIPEKFALKATNFYSLSDGITGLSGAAHLLRGEKYDIQFISSQTPFEDRTMYLFDHTFLGKTYQNALQESIREINRNIGFARDNAR